MKYFVFLSSVLVSIAAFSQSQENVDLYLSKVRASQIVQSSQIKHIPKYRDDQSLQFLIDVVDAYMATASSKDPIVQGARSSMSSAFQRPMVVSAISPELEPSMGSDFLPAVIHSDVSSGITVPHTYPKHLTAKQIRIKNVAVLLKYNGEVLYATNLATRLVEAIPNK